MDSGNSGSMQSSSGGDEIEEHDSSSMANPSFLLPLPFSSAHHHSAAAAIATFFDFPNPFISPPTIMPQLPSLPSSHHHKDSLNLDPDSILNHSRPFPSPPASITGVGAVAKNPKKRTRASRRAPTTVLTTDTSNFRAMVQEFTGIPSPPFSTGHSHSSGRRLEIFRSPPNSGHLDSLNYNPFRGSIQKVQTLIPSSSSSPASPSILNHHITVDATNVATSMAIPATNTANYRVFSDLHLPKLPLSNQWGLDEYNATIPGGIINGGDHLTRNVPPMKFREFDRRSGKDNLEIHNKSSSTPINKDTATTTTLDQWISSTDH